MNKLYINILAISLLMFSTKVFADIKPVGRLIEDPEEPKIETIEQYAFFVLDVKNKGAVPQYGDRIELVFDKHTRVTLYNLSGKDIRYFTDTDGKLVAFIPPEYLRCFQNHTLKKVIFRDNQKKIVMKAKTPTNYFKQIK